MCANRTEYDIARIPGSHLIPLGELPSRMSELDSADEIVIHCKSGMRSAKALRELQKAGFGKLFNVEGGISAWADRVDTSVPNIRIFNPLNRRRAIHRCDSLLR